ncbi:alpha/beta fold hydrolase [Marilutibacter aestuarii]|uniref:Alpha/beta hydrolase n=1 Tax=Marilutibacter aestuarii TaxID=1706195 RepID=A0A508AA73_9GAMM|nr:alpha/beta hydrolase [Lysobacter aestuarii]TQD46327.1 alpha/beta hydrolase [Lysobacter aestuarii]
MSPALEATTHHVDVAGVRAAYRSIGEGPVLLMANRFRGTLDTWDPRFLDALARERRVIVFDFPGVGYSDGEIPDDIALASAFIDGLASALGLDRFALLGWSWGGLAVQAYLLEHGQRLTHAVLLATNPPGELQIPLQPSFLERALKPVNDLEDEYVLFHVPDSEHSRARARASFGRIHAREGVVDRIPSSPDQFQRYFAAAAGFHADPGDRRGRLGAAGLPLLVLCGDHDSSTAGGNWFPLIGALPDARFVYYGDTGHAPHHQYPEIVADAILGFLSEARG